MSPPKRTVALDDEHTGQVHGRVVYQRFHVIGRPDQRQTLARDMCEPLHSTHEKECSESSSRKSSLQLAQLSTFSRFVDLPLSRAGLS